MKSKFEGVITAMVTPLRGEQKKIDLEATDSLVDFLIEKGVNGLFILGTLARVCYSRLMSVGNLPKEL